jgi:hypothetical protein
MGGAELCGPSDRPIAGQVPATCPRFRVVGT